MKLIKKELIVSVIIIIAFVFIGMNVSVLATGASVDYPWNNMPKNTDNNSDLIEVVGNKDEEVVVNNSSRTNNTNTTNNANKPGQLADTGLEDAPWLTKLEKIKIVNNR